MSTATFTRRLHALLRAMASPPASMPMVLLALLPPARTAAATDDTPSQPTAGIARQAPTAPTPVTLATPDEIARLIEQLPAPPPMPDSIWHAPHIDHGFGLRCRRTDGGRIVDHVGLRLFTADVRQHHDPVICDCIERLLLTLSLQQLQPAPGVQPWLAQHGVRLTLDGYAFGHRHFATLAPAFAALAATQSLTIDDTGETYVCTLAGQSRATDASAAIPSASATPAADAPSHTLTLTLPKDRSLLFATDKKEADDRIALRLAATRGATLPDAPAPDRDRLSPTATPGISQMAGDAFLIDRMRSTTYWTMLPDAPTGNAAAQGASGHAAEASGRWDNGATGYAAATQGVRPVWDSAYPDLSLTDMMLLTAGDADADVTLTHKVYGLTPIVGHVRWADLIQTLRADDPTARIYAASRTDTADPTRLSSVAVVYSQRYQYVHLLLVTTTVARLFATPRPTLEVTLYTHVPQAGVRDLFE